MKHTNKMVNIESNPLNGSSFMNDLRNKYMEKQTAVEWLYDRLLFAGYAVNPEWKEQAKEMEKEKYKKFNKFLNDEKELGLSDLNTIERIQWYYNTYFNETFNIKDK
jgi:hypothetical protein